MLETRARHLRWLAKPAIVATLLLSGAIAKGEVVDPDASGDPQPSPANQSPPPSLPPETKAAPPQVDGAFIEHMGPDTFPGRLRGLYGGSLWLEPDFQGLQWPRNTRTGLGVSANLWVDNGYEVLKRQSDQLPNTNLWFQQGRGMLRLTPAYVSGTFFVQGQVELVGNLCQAANSVCLNSGTFTTDDLFIRLGQWNRWDLQVGRFEAWEVYHLGMGMDPYTLERLGAGMFGVESFTTPALEVPTLYGVTFLHDRPTDGLAVGYLALHLYPTDYLRFELLAKLGDDNYRADNSTGDTPANYLGGRPTVVFDVGWLKLRVGAEYQKITPTTQTVQPGTPGHKVDAVAERKQKGVGGSVQFVIDPIVEFGVNAAIGSQSDNNAFGQPVPESVYTVKSIGGFANVRLATPWLAGIGVNWTTQRDSFVAADSNVGDFTAQLQGFAALQYALASKFYVRAVLGLARADFLPSDPMISEWQNYMYSGRIRLMYLY